MKFLALDTKGKDYRLFITNIANGEMISADFDNKEELYTQAERLSRSGYDVDMYEWDYDIDMYIPF